MPAPDPIRPLGPIRRQFLRIMRVATLFALAMAALAVVLVARGDTALHVHVLIATALGVGLSVLLGIALMALVVVSGRMGQDVDTADHYQKENHDPRS